MMLHFLLNSNSAQLLNYPSCYLLRHVKKNRILIHCVNGLLRFLILFDWPHFCSDQASPLVSTFIKPTFLWIDPKPRQLDSDPYKIIKENKKLIMTPPVGMHYLYSLSDARRSRHHLPKTRQLAPSSRPLHYDQ